MRFYLFRQSHPGVNIKKVEDEGEEDAQICTVAKKFVIQGRPQIMIMESKQAIYYIYFLFTSRYVHCMLLI